jgi:alpha-ketoglutarate-dependent 2,4-dichlorophenoxyacetate dioxygenase
MALTATPLHALFAAEISGLDLRRPVGDADLAAFLAAMARHGVCVVHHDAPLTDDQHIAFSARLGPLERGASPKIAGTGLRVARNEIIDQANLDEHGEIYRGDDRRILFKRANRLWHTDMSFHANRATFSLLSAHEVPPAGGDTQFADMRSVHDALDGAMKVRIENLAAEHSYWHSRQAGGGPEPTEEERQSRPPARHRLVHVHQGSGRKALYIASHATHIVGWPVAKGRALLDELMAFATRPEFTFGHKWRVGDVVIWDNLCTMHRAMPFEDTRFRRDMRRATCRAADPAQV